MDASNMRVFVIFFVCTFCVSMVMSYCSFSPLEQDEETVDGAGFCLYHDWRLEIGSIIRSPMPNCEMCRCTKYGLNCCGYGRKSGIIAVPAHCKMVSRGGSCEYSLVRKDNPGVKC